MILFRLPLTMGLLGAALILTVWGALSKRGSVLSFFGALCCAASVISGLVGGAQLQETLLYVMLTLGVSFAGEIIPCRKGE